MNRPSPDDMKAIQVMEYVEQLEKESKLLKARNEELNENCYGLAKENKELKNELMEDMKYEEKLEKENKELKKKLDILYHHV